MQYFIEGYTLEASNEAVRVSTPTRLETYHDLHICDEDHGIRDHPAIDQTAKQLIGRQAEVEEQKGELDDPMCEVVVDFFDKEDPEDHELLPLADRLYVPSQGVSIPDRCAFRRSKPTGRIPHEEIGVE